MFVKEGSLPQACAPWTLFLGPISRRSGAVTGFTFLPCSDLLTCVCLEGTGPGPGAAVSEGLEGGELGLGWE